MGFPLHYVLQKAKKGQAHGQTDTPPPRKKKSKSKKKKSKNISCAGGSALPSGQEVALGITAAEPTKS